MSYSKYSTFVSGGLCETPPKVPIAILTKKLHYYRLSSLANRIFQYDLKSLC